MNDLIRRKNVSSTYNLHFTLAMTSSVQKFLLAQLVLVCSLEQEFANFCWVWHVISVDKYNRKMVGYVYQKSSKFPKGDVQTPFLLHSLHTYRRMYTYIGNYIARFILSTIVSIIMVLFTILAYAMIMYLCEEWASNNMNRIYTKVNQL